jgi:EAL domain-containing protein (putative c-di-GMP-specific phosphodiesterase class I)
MAEQVRRSLRTPMKIADKEVILTGSVGIAVYDGQQSQPEDLLKEAEIAMLRAKRSGTDRIDIFKADMRDETDDRLPLESDLRRALERGQISVLFQPIMRLSDESVAGFEALMRWDHPKHGRLNPDDFIPIAEESGLMGALGAHVVQQAVENAAEWHDVYTSEHGPLFVSINISSRQLFKQDMIQQIRLVLSSDLVPEGTLWLEFTESLVMENPEQAIENMKMLKDLGACLSLDDFGTGYSSLSYLQRFPIDAIKVDRSFVRDSELNGSSPVILKSVIALSHELDKVVVAEGIETEKDATYLRLIGCEYGQGFFYGEPQEQTKVVRLLKALAKIERKTKRAKPQPLLPAADQTLAMLKSPVPQSRPVPGTARPQPRSKPAQSAKPQPRKKPVPPAAKPVAKPAARKPVPSPG